MFELEFVCESFWLGTNSCGERGKAARNEHLLFFYCPLSDARVQAMLSSSSPAGGNRIKADERANGLAWLEIKCELVENRGCRDCSAEMG